MRERIITNHTRLYRNIVVDTDILLTFDSEVRDDIDDKEFVDIIVSQGLRNIKKLIQAYEQCDLPNIFLTDQRFIITNKLPSSIHGYYSIPSDDIVLDADSISNIRRIESSFLFGHEMGHKIDRYRDTLEAYKEIAKVFQMSMEGNEHNLKELYADICGLIVTNHNLQEESPKITHLKRKVLGDLHRL